MSLFDVSEWDLPLEDFAVRVREIGDGEPILCIHGGPGMSSGYFFPDPDVWGPGLRALAADHRVVAYDQRGCGGSGVPDVEQPLALSRHVDDVESVRAALGLERPIVLAHSFGSVLAILFALQHPESLSGLVILGGAPTRAFMAGYRQAVAAELPLGIQERLAEIQSGEIDDEAMRERFRLALPLYFHRTLSDTERDSLLSTLRFSGAVNRAVAAGLENYDLSTALPHVRAPSLVIYGASDRVVQPAYQLEFRGRLLTARFVEFQESGHFPFLEEPDPFARVVHYFAAHGGR
ncbi:MAG TPA: alpha/beta fold hydrolase [Gemmatimonadota bacterium]|nr:alpha/beta fold hydrolase [Gemmatimonadota bacterium]